MSDTWWHDFLWKSYYIRRVYTHTDVFSWIRFLGGKYFVSVSVVIVCMLARDNIWSLCTPSMQSVKCLLGKLSPGLLFWQASDMLSKSISYLVKELEWPQVWRVPSAPPDTLLLEVCCDRRFEEFCAKRQLSSLLKCYLSIWMDFLFHFFPI